VVRGAGPLSKIPYQVTTLLGYFYRVGAPGRPRPTVIATNVYGNRPERAYGLGLVKTWMDRPHRGGTRLQHHSLL